MVFQYTASVVLIVGTIIVFRQLDFMRKENLGFNMDQMLVVRGPDLTRWDSSAITRINAFNRTQAIPVYTGSQRIDQPVRQPACTDFQCQARRFRSGKGATFSRMDVDLDFFHTYQIKMLAGRDFIPTDSDPDPNKARMPSLTFRPQGSWVCATQNLLLVKSLYCTTASGKSWGWSAISINNH